MPAEQVNRDITTTSRLRWRCRRGMRELDTLLERWLVERWPAADPSARACFERLLGCEDDQLWDWCMGRSTPDDPELAGIVKEVVDPAETGGRTGFGD
ncbi:MAG TPA: succinate dehydrogenase assembly factor 2 [Wenzhouxiangellaceae bacterium]|nr:succinate dehydrogenase assembly factor 2 [Wenzhouxiangellaceae bacterium]